MAIEAINHLPLQGENILEPRDIVAKVPKHIIGGLESRLGQVVFSHKGGLSFVNFDRQNIRELNEGIQKVLNFFKRYSIKNALILGREEPGKPFKLRVIPYVHCTIFEKLQKLGHIVFGPTLQLEANARNMFCLNYQNSDFAPHEDMSRYEIQEDSKRNEEEFYKDHMDFNFSHSDAFCNSNIIKNQLIDNKKLNNNNYHVLHDYRPLGEPHLLIVPEGVIGHQDCFMHSAVQREEMLILAQEQMQRIRAKDEESTLLYVERCGKDLRSVDHMHGHVIGIPAQQGFFSKIVSSIKMIWPAFIKALDFVRLSPKQLETAIDNQKEKLD